MGAIAEANAPAIYGPHGIPNPFVNPTASVPVMPLWDWPIVEQALSRGTGGLGPMNPYSALKMFGYTVGRTNGWPRAKRERFLSDFMEMDLPADVEATFDDEYGEPMSTTRLRKVATVIASNASNFHRNDPVRYGMAIADWESDLSFLKRKYYEGAGLAFHPWPSSKPT